MPEADTMTPVQAARADQRASRAIAIREPDMKWLDIPRAELVPTLLQSLYPGAKAESVNAVLDYCEAAGLNVMLKPVHIVPMNVKEGREYKWRDVIMPGINHYRTQASRTGTYVGKSEPEFGPLVERKWGNFSLQVPEWCKVTVRRLVGGHVAEFTAFEYWDENYANKGRDDPSPNAMWRKRPRGQLHKCAEAQALRMAFPELVGGETAEEMEGKVIELEALPDATAPKAASKSLDQFSGATKAEPEDAEVEDVKDEKPEPDLLTEMPDMPAKAAKAWTEKADWKPGWKWLNEIMDAVTQEVRQQLAVEHAALLWAVYNSDLADKGPQSKAAAEFSERYRLVIPPVKDGANGK